MTDRRIKGLLANLEHARQKHVIFASQFFVSLAEIAYIETSLRNARRDPWDTRPLEHEGDPNCSPHQWDGDLENGQMFCKCGLRVDILNPSSEEFTEIVNSLYGAEEADFQGILPLANSRGFDDLSSGMNKEELREATGFKLSQDEVNSVLGVDKTGGLFSNIDFLKGSDDWGAPFVEDRQK